MPEFGPLDLRVEPADDRAAREVALDDEVVARGGEERGAARPDGLRQTEDAQVGPLLGQGLVEHDAFQRPFAIVEGNDRIAAHEEGREPLFRFLAGFTLSGDARLVAGGEDAGDVDKLGFA